MPFMPFEALKKYATFSGRARRAEYWQFILLSFIAGAVIGVVETALGLSRAQGGSGMLGNIVSLAFVIPSIAAGWRRMHDSDHPGAYIFIPFYNLYLAVIPGTNGDNKYGPDPKRPLVDLKETFA